MLLILVGLYSSYWHFIWRSVMQEITAFVSAQRAEMGHVCGRYFLAKQPEVMAKLEAELDAAGLLVTAQSPRPRAFTFADISKLRYLECVIKVAHKFASCLAWNCWQPVSDLHLNRAFAGSCAQDFGLRSLVWLWQSIDLHVTASVSLSCAHSGRRMKGLYSQQPRRQDRCLQSISCL